LTRRDFSFPVSRPQGVGNWETAADPLIPNKLHLPSTLGKKRGSGKLESGSSAVGSGRRNTLNQPAPPMAIQRRYQPTSGTLDAVVEALYHLLADTEPSVTGSASTPRRDGAGGKAAT
jgi:hypothetical protein